MKQLEGLAWSLGQRLHDSADARCALGELEPFVGAGARVGEPVHDGGRGARGIVGQVDVARALPLPRAERVERDVPRDAEDPRTHRSSSL